MSMKKTTWSSVLKLIIALASAMLGAFGANAMNTLH